MQPTNPSLETSLQLKPKITLIRPHFRADIEGLRAIAILLVVGYHAGFTWLKGGFIGVDIFYVLSGYLITWLLVYEAQEKGKINLVRFYARRSRRLLPAVFVTILVTSAVSALVYAPFEQRFIANTAISASAYASNFYFAREALDYLGGNVNANTLLHTWSLAVEEQFYIFWPLFTMFALGILGLRVKQLSPGNRVLVWMTVVAVASFSLSLYLTSKRQPWAFFLSPTRAWEFAVGALGLLIPALDWAGLATKRSPALRFLSMVVLRLKNLGLVSWLGIAGLIYAAVTFDQNTSFPGTAVLLPVFATILILREGAQNQNSSTVKVLNTGILQLVGKLSYSWYLWHWPIFIFANLLISPLTLWEVLGLLAFSLLVSAASYRFVENPIRNNARLQDKPGLSLGLAALITVSGIAISFAWRQVSSVEMNKPSQTVFTAARDENPEIYALGCQLDYTSTAIDVEKCTFGSKTAPTRVVLYGDSHAGQWFPAVKQVALDKGWQLLSLTKGSCPYFDSPIYLDVLGREYTECEQWREAVLQEMERVKPYLVIATSSTAYPMSDEAWLKATEAGIKGLSERAEHVVILRDTPRFNVDVTTYIARKTWSPLVYRYASDLVIGYDLSPRNFDLLLKAARNFDNVFVADMDTTLCPGSVCRMEQNGKPLYRDSNHLTVEYSQSLAPALAEEIDRFLRK